MKRTFLSSLLLLAFVVATIAPAYPQFAKGGGGHGGGGGGGPQKNPPGTMEVRTLSETIPAGGAVQIKHLLTQPHPISSGGAGIALNGFSIAGVALFSPLGDAVGVAVPQNGSLLISVLSPLSDFGTNIDYPFLMETMDIPSTTPAGSTFVLDLAANSVFQSSTGPLTLVDPKPGTLTIGGSVSIRSVNPGGGNWPAGTVISVQGTGFDPKTRLSTKTLNTDQPVYISSTEMRFTLTQPATMDTQPIQATNPDGSQVTYYSYLRGVLIQPPSRPLLQITEPMFQTQTFTTAVVGPLPVKGVGQFTALAIQNPGTAAVTLTFRLQSTGANTTIVLPSGGRVMDELSALLGGIVIATGDTVTVTASSGVEVIGINGDETTGLVTPFLPALF